MNRPFLAWPGWAFLRFAWLLSGVETLWFVFVYGGCNWVTAHRVWRVRLDLPGELLIPFIPGMTVFYLSIYLLFLAGPFVIRERREFASLIVALILTTLCGGIGFLLLPAQPAYAPPGSLGIWAAPFHFADWVNLDYNMAPSLHVALSVCCVAAFSRHATRRVQRMLWGWAGAIGLSTLLVHQHYVVDVVSGWGLGLAAHRLCQRSDGLLVSAIGRRLWCHRKLAGTILGFAVAIGGSVWVAGWLRVPHTLNQPLPQAVYLWQRQWTDPVRAAATRATAPESTFNELLVFGAEIVAADRSGREVSVAPVTGLDWSLLAKAQRPVGMVVRVRGAQGTAEPRGKVFEALRETVETLCIDAKRAGIKLEEVQVDFDCPTSRLREFAELLAALRHALPDERWTFTALPSWLHSSAFATLARAADGYVLQVHSFETTGPDRRPPTTLCDPDQAKQVVERAARLGRPFRVALPTYSYRLVLDSHGVLLAAAAEGAPLERAQPPPGGSARRLEADPQALAALIAAWKAKRPAALQGVVWYRLPVPGSDRLNWPPATLAAVMAGHEPHVRLFFDLASSRKAADAPSAETDLWELRLHNTGDALAALPATVQVRCSATPLAVEGLGAYEIAGNQLAADGARLILWRRRDGSTGRSLAPGTTLACGWLRLPQPLDDKPIVVLPSEARR